MGAILFRYLVEASQSPLLCAVRFQALRTYHVGVHTSINIGWQQCGGVWRGAERVKNPESAMSTHTLHLPKPSLRSGDICGRNTYNVSGDGYQCGRVGRSPVNVYIRLPYTDHQCHGKTVTPAPKSGNICVGDDLGASPASQRSKSARCRACRTKRLPSTQVHLKSTTHRCIRFNLIVLLYVHLGTYVFSRFFVSENKEINFLHSMFVVTVFNPTPQAACHHYILPRVHCYSCNS